MHEFIAFQLQLGTMHGYWGWFGRMRLGNQKA